MIIDETITKLEKLKGNTIYITVSELGNNTFYEWNFKINPLAKTEIEAEMKWKKNLFSTKAGIETNDNCFDDHDFFYNNNEPSASVGYYEPYEGVISHNEEVVHYKFYNGIIVLRFSFPNVVLNLKNLVNKIENWKEFTENCISTNLDETYCKNSKNYCFLVLWLINYQNPIARSEIYFHCVTLVIPKNYSFFEFSCCLAYLYVLKPFINTTISGNYFIDLSILANIFEKAYTYKAEWLKDGEFSMESNSFQWMVQDQRPFNK